MPLDRFVLNPAVVMQVVGDPNAVPDIVSNFQEVFTETADYLTKLGKFERFAFYDRAKSAFAIVQAGETRLYGNITLKKGVIGT